MSNLFLKVGAILLSVVVLFGLGALGYFTGEYTGNTAISASLIAIFTFLGSIVSVIILNRQFSFY